MGSATIVMTGASDGIGAAAARQLARSGDHRLLLVGRSPEKTAAVAQEVGAESFVADFARFDDVRRLARELDDALGDEPIDVLANNAGGILGDHEPTVDGHEQTMQVNHLSPFLLTNLLLPRLLRPGHASAVVTTSSIAHRLFGRLGPDDVDALGATESDPRTARGLSAHRSYGDAKLANVLFTKSLHEKFHARGLSAVAFHPGNVATNFASETSSILRLMYRTLLRRMLITPERGGETLAWFIDGVPGVGWVSGEYYDERARTDRVNPRIHDADLAERLWQRSAAVTGISSGWGS